MTAAFFLSNGNAVYGFDSSGAVVASLVIDAFIDGHALGGHQDPISGLHRAANDALEEFTETLASDLSSVVGTWGPSQFTGNSYTDLLYDAVDSVVWGVTADGFDAITLDGTSVTASYAAGRTVGRACLKSDGSAVYYTAPDTGDIYQFNTVTHAHSLFADLSAVLDYDDGIIDIDATANGGLVAIYRNGGFNTNAAVAVIDSTGTTIHTVTSAALYAAYGTDSPNLGAPNSGSVLVVGGSAWIAASALSGSAMVRVRLSDYALLPAIDLVPIELSGIWPAMWAAPLPVTNCTVATVAGSTSGFANGTGSAAKFNNPLHLSAHGADLLVADPNNHRIRLVTADGVVSTFAGTGAFGNTDGPVATATLFSPQSVLSDGTDVYISSLGSPNRIRKVSGGTVSTLASFAGGENPQGMCFHPDGSLLVAAFATHVVYKVTLAGVVTVWSGTSGTSGPSDGSGSTAQINQPTDVTVDDSGYVYVSCYGNGIGYVRKYQSDGTVVGNVFVFPDVDGFDGPAGIDYHASRLYITSADASTVVSIALDGTDRQHVAGDPNYTVGPDDYDGDPLLATFHTPWGLTWLGGVLYIVDNANNKIRSYACSGCTFSVGQRVLCIPIQGGHDYVVICTDGG